MCKSLSLCWIMFVEGEEKMINLKLNCRFRNSNWEKEQQRGEKFSTNATCRRESRIFTRKILIIWVRVATVNVKSHFWGNLISKCFFCNKIPWNYLSDLGEMLKVIPWCFWGCIKKGWEGMEIFRNIWEKLFIWKKILSIFFFRIFIVIRFQLRVK